MSREVMAGLRHQLQVMRLCFEQRAEVEREHAKLLFAKYDGLLAAGFCKAQAMDIVTERGLL